MGRAGWSGLALLLLIGFPLTFVPLVLQTFLGDRDKYGTVPVPGSAVIELPADKVTVFFQETGTFGENEGANEPDGFEFEVAPESGGEPLALDGAGFFALSATTGNHAYDPIGTVEPPDEGRYAVSSESDVGDAQSPALSFGTGSSGQVPRVTMYGLGAVGIGSLLLVIGVVRSSRRESG